MALGEKLKKKLPLFIAIACGVLAILLLNNYLQNRERELLQRYRRAEQALQEQAEQQKAEVIQATGETREVLIAKRNIPARAEISPNDLSISKVPVKYIQPGALSSPRQVIGQMAALPIAKGEQILKTKIVVPAKLGDTLSGVTPEGKRAVAVPVDNISSIGGLIQPGDYVDVFALITPPPISKWPEGERNTPQLVPLFQGVRVLAVGEDLIDVSGISSEKKKPKKTRGNTITLALSPQEAILFSFVQDHGKIKLTLRSPDDVSAESVKQADWDTLFQYLYPRTGQAGLETRGAVEIYRGLEREVVPVFE